MIRFTRLLALAIFAFSALNATFSLAQDEERTAGRQAGEPLRPAPETSEKPVVPPAPKAPQKDTAKTNAKNIKAQSASKPTKPEEQAKPDGSATPEAEAEAETKPELKVLPDEKILKVDFPDLESIGLYAGPQDGSLGRDLWTNSHRSVLMEYVPALKTVRRSPVLQFITSGVLLSETQANLIVNDVAPTPGQDLLTLRLMKLMDLGMNDQALAIYSDLGRTPYHSNLAQAGIMALLFNGEKSLACLEYKTVEDRNFHGPFWTDIALYCGYVLEDKKPSPDELGALTSEAVKRVLSDEGYSFAYDASKLESIPLFDRAILTAEHSINFGPLGLAGINRIAPAHLTLALKKQNLSREDDFLLKLKMVQYGLKQPTEWEKLYASYKFGGAADEQKIITLESLPGWQQLPALYQNAKTLEKEKASAREQQALALKALDYIGTYGLAAAYPFADLLATVPADNLSTEQLVLLARVLNGADKDIPGGWFGILSKRKAKSEKEVGLYVLSYIAKAYQQTNPDDKAPVMKAVEGLKNSTLKESFKIIIENVDNRSIDDHTVNKVYDNGSDLTSNGNYVMPSKRVWDRLIASSQNQRIGETVLLSMVLLNEKPLMDLYPGVLGDVLKGLRAVGLTRFAKGVAQEALLETL